VFCHDCHLLSVSAHDTAVEDRAVDLGRDRFPQTNEWLYTVVTIRTRDGQETLAITTIDVPLVHAALELANAEDPSNCGP
jgi:hypothetical protein